MMNGILSLVSLSDFSVLVFKITRGLCVLILYPEPLLYSLICSRNFLVAFLGFSMYSILEKAMAPHSSTLAWKVPWAEEPGGLQSMGSLRVGHDWSDLAAAAAAAACIVSCQLQTVTDIFLLQCEFLLFLFLLWLLWLGLSKLCGIIVVKVGNFFLFLILEEMISVCNHWEQCLQWVCCIRPLLYWGNCFYVDFLEGFFF